MIKGTVLEEFGAAPDPLSDEQEARKIARDKRWRNAIEKRSEWPPERFQEEEKRLAREIEDWIDRKAA